MCVNFFHTLILLAHQQLNRWWRRAVFRIRATSSILTRTATCSTCTSEWEGKDSEESMWMSSLLDLPSYLFSNSRQTPDSGLGNEELRNSMNNASGDNSGSSAGGGAPPGFVSDLPFWIINNCSFQQPNSVPNPYFLGNAQQSQYNGNFEKSLCYLFCLI